MWIHGPSGELTTSSRVRWGPSSSALGIKSNIGTLIIRRGFRYIMLNYSAIIEKEPPKIV